MFLPDTISPNALSALSSLGANSLAAINDTSIGSGSAVSVICAFPLSGQYGPGARALYYVLVVICIAFNHVEWARGASLAAALLFPAVAALHALVIAPIAQSHGAVDNDIFGTFQLCAIGVLCVPITVRYSRTYFESKGRNMVFMWTVLNLAGLLGLIVAFYRATPEPCLDSSGQNVTLANFWGLQQADPQGVCQTTRWPQGCVVTTPIRKDPSNPSQWVPAPHHGMTLNTATLLCAACCIPAVLSLLSVWQKVIHLRWIRRWTGRRGSIDTTTGGIRDSPTPMNADDEKALEDKERAEDQRWMERRIRLILGLVERIVFSVCIIAIVVLGEENFWSHEMRAGVEPMTSIGQWGPIVGAALATFGSLFALLSNTDDGDSELDDDPEENQEGTTPTDANGQTIGGHRARVNRGVFKVLKILGTPGADRFQDEMRSRKYRDYPLVPGEKDRNPHAERTRSEFRDRQETAAMSRRPSFSSIRSPSLDHVRADGGGPENAGPSGLNRGDHRWFPDRERAMSNSSLIVPEPAILSGSSFSPGPSSPPPHSGSPTPPPSSPPPPRHPNLPSPRSPTNRRRSSSHKKSSSGDKNYLTVRTRRHETNPPQPETSGSGFGGDEPGSRPRSPTVPIPTIFVTPVDSEPPQGEPGVKPPRR